jgi:Arc/MetJ family transcription regulator
MTKGSVDIDDELLREAQRLTGIKSKRAVVLAALEHWVRLLKQDRAQGRRGGRTRKNELKN